jgi:hypothetical protein
MKTYIAVDPKRDPEYEGWQGTGCGRTSLSLKADTCETFS